MGFSWLSIVTLKAPSCSWPIFMGFSWDFCGPTKSRINGILGLFSWRFRAPPTVENMRKPTALESTEENIFSGLREASAQIAG